MVIAHRGASDSAPENTLAAFDHALQMGVRHIELDVQLTHDGHVVVIHDDTVDRTTNGSGAISSFSLSALQSLDAGSWFREEFSGERVPAFHEVLKRYRGRAHLHTEIKGRSPALSQMTADLIRAHGMEKKVTITSFQEARLEEMRAYARELSRGWLVTDTSEETIAKAHAMNVNQLCPQADKVTPELVQRIHAAGFDVRVWGVKTGELMQQVVRAGSDGMTINFPDKLISFLDSIQQSWR